MNSRLMISNNLRHTLWAPLALLLCSSCGTVFEDGEVCPDIPPVPEEPVVYKVRFDDSRNMNFADAFPVEVKSLSLYVAESQSKAIVWTYNENDLTKLQSGSYELELPLGPGTYDLVAWCGLGLGSSTDVQHSFGPVYTPSEVSKLEQLSVQLKGGVNEPWSANLDELHHGMLTSQTLPDQSTTLVMPLTRNTNNVRVILKRIDGTDLDESDFSFEITADNGLMDYDNSLMADDQRTYVEYVKSNKSIDGVVAVSGEVRTARMVEGHSMRLKALYQGSPILNIPLINYALLVKGYYDQPMDDQEFLDRQNDWTFFFLLNDQNQWEHSNLFINDWHVVVNDLDL